MTRTLLALIGLACVLFLSVGWFMGWYTYTREDGKLTFLIFTDRVEDGLKKIKDGAVNLKNSAAKALTKPEDAPKNPPATGLSYLFGPAAAPQQPTTAPATPTGLPPANLPMPQGGR